MKLGYIRVSIKEPSIAQQKGELSMELKTLRNSLQEDINSFELALKTGKDLDIWIEELQSSLKANYYGHVIDENTFNILWHKYFGEN